MKIFPIVLILFLISGCSMPYTSVRSVDSRPSLAVEGASSEDELIVDGLNMGKAKIYNGHSQTLTIEPGTHKIKIVANGMVVYEQTIFVESELKTITVH